MALEEAIEMLRGMQNKKMDYAEMVCAPAFAYGYQYVYPEPEDYAIEEAIKALEEIQQYREIGTIEELKYYKDMKVRLEKYHANISVSRLLECFIETVFENTRHEGFIILTNKEAKDYETYCSIGTVEECREAVERLEAKPVKNRKILRNFHGNPYGIQGDCPNCGCERITSMSTDWCHVCGQHLKYDENLEGMEDE